MNANPALSTELPSLDLAERPIPEPVVLGDPISAAQVPFEPDALDQSNFLRRPEAVVLVIFAFLLTCWDAYLELLDEIDPEYSLSSGELAKRLGVEKRKIRRKKHQPDFSEWTQSLDPTGTAWVYQNGLYSPVSRV